MIFYSFKYCNFLNKRLFLIELNFILKYKINYCKFKVILFCVKTFFRSW